VSVTLTATIVPASGNTVPPGAVQFMDGPSNVGASQPVAAGLPDQARTATVTTAFTKAGSGRHSLTAYYTPSVTGPSASGGAIPQDVMGTNASLVNAAYVTMLGHPAERASGNRWIDQITNYGVARGTLAMALASAPEYRTNVISGNTHSGSGLDFYSLYLDRSFDPAGGNYWVSRMAGVGGSPLTFEQVRLQFAGSPEYFSSALVGNNDKLTAIRALYTDLLGRTDGGNADTAGQTYWMGHYDATLIAAQFLFSQEGRSFLVNNVYTQILSRPAESGGLSFWTNALLGGASDENIIASILSSDEYFTSH
jgi:hypothetical protein